MKRVVGCFRCFPSLGGDGRVAFGRCTRAIVEDAKGLASSAVVAEMVFSDKPSAEDWLASEYPSVPWAWEPAV